MSRRHRLRRSRFGCGRWPRAVMAGRDVFSPRLHFVLDSCRDDVLKSENYVMGWCVHGAPARFSFRLPRHGPPRGWSRAAESLGTWPDVTRPALFCVCRAGPLVVRSPAAAILNVHFDPVAGWTQPEDPTCGEAGLNVALVCRARPACARQNPGKHHPAPHRRLTPGDVTAWSPHLALWPGPGGSMLATRKSAEACCRGVGESSCVVPVCRDFVARHPDDRPVELLGPQPRRRMLIRVRRRAPRRRSCQPTNQGPFMPSS